VLMSHWKRLLAVAALATLGAASALSHPSGAEASEPGAAEDALLLRLGDVLATSQSAERNAQALATRVRAELRGCGSVEVAGAAVALSASGCPLQDGLRLSGPLTLQVHRGARGLTVVLTEGAQSRGAEASAAAQGADALAWRR
jgi:hypothetical protein